MSEDLQELFQAAAKFFFHKYKEGGGNLQKLAEHLGTSHTYVSSVINGSRSASLDMQSKIAQVLYGPFDRFIAAGRRIMRGQEPEAPVPVEPREDVEMLIARLTHYIMHHKDIERQLVISEQKFRDISLTTGDIIFELDEKLAITYLEGRVREVVGRDREELLGVRPYDLFEPRLREELEKMVNDAIRGNRILDYSFSLMQNGEEKHRHVAAKPVFNANGDFKGFRGTYRDTTEKRRMEQAMAEQNWLFESAIDSVDTIGMVIIDREARVLKWNRHYQEMLGYPDSVLATRSLSGYVNFLADKLAEPDDFYKYMEAMKNTAETIEHILKLKDGRTIKKTMYPMFRDGVLSGRIAHLVEVKEKRKSGRGF